MMFIHPLLLSGLALAGLPVILHLLSRQQPKRLPFPALRFLQQRRRVNQRRIRLRHWLLLLLRVLLIALFCLALARPRIFSDRLSLGAEQPVTAVLVIDTSPSMEYSAAGKTRLDDAKDRAIELLESLPADSRVAVLDTAESGAGQGGSGRLDGTINIAREQVRELAIRADSRAVSDALVRAYDLFAGLTGDATVEALPRLLFVFSDRTVASWKAESATDLQHQRDALAPQVPKAVWVDVGVEAPTDVSIDRLEMSSQAISQKQLATFRVSVRATGADVETVLACAVDGNAPSERRPVRLKAGSAQTLSFELADLTPGFHSLEFSLATPDAVPFNNSRFATIEVRPPREVLILADDPNAAFYWKIALETGRLFTVTVKDTLDATLRDLAPTELGKYRVVCLLSVANPDRFALWGKLRKYVTAGGGLIVLPGGDELQQPAYNDNADAQFLLPGKIGNVITSKEPAGTSWSTPNYARRLMQPFKDWAQRADVDIVLNPPVARRYRDVKPQSPDVVLVQYNDTEHHPALLEQVFERSPTGVQGGVILFTVPWDERKDTRTSLSWTDYISTSFGVVLPRLTTTYLAGDTNDATWNFSTGSRVVIPLPPVPRFPSYSVERVGGGAQATIQHGEGQAELTIPDTRLPGNYKVVGGTGEWTAGFSINPDPSENQLERVSVETIEATLGEGSVLPVGREVKLADAFKGKFTQPLELFGPLLLLLLLCLALENLLANKFYKGEGTTPPSESGAG